MTWGDGLEPHERAIWDEGEATGWRKGFGCGVIVAAVLSFVWTLIVRALWQ